MDKWWRDEISRWVSKGYRSVYESLLDNVGDVLGSGDQGYVFKYSSSQAIKFVVDGCFSPKLFNRIRKINSPGVVRIDSFGDLGDAYYYVMERLRPLTTFEYNVFWDMTDDLSCAPKNSIRFQRSQALINELSVVRSKGLGYCDIHYGNIMKNKSAFKVVDLEGFYNVRT